MIQFSLPMRVTPTSCAVPRLIVTYSRMVLSSPISTLVGSPLYFLSWGAAPMDANWKTRLRRPMRTRPSITTCGPMELPSPISTSAPTTANAPISTSAASRAPGRTPPRPLRHARELADAAQHPLHLDVELELVARDHRFLEAGVVDADVIVDVLVMVGALVAADDEGARRLGHRLEDHHAGHDRPSRKVALEIGLVRGHVLERDDALVGLAMLHPVDLQDGFALRQFFQHREDSLLGLFFFSFSSERPRSGSRSRWRTHAV